MRNINSIFCIYRTWNHFSKHEVIEVNNILLLNLFDQDNFKWSNFQWQKLYLEHLEVCEYVNTNCMSNWKMRGERERETKKKCNIWVFLTNLNYETIEINPNNQNLLIHGDYLAGSNYMQVLHPNHSLKLTTHVSSDEFVHLTIPQFICLLHPLSGF